MSLENTAINPTTKRLNGLDIARGIALIAMAIYHLIWDFEFFGYLPAGTASEGGWKIFARCIAASFLMLVGFSLVLAHTPQIRWKAFNRRLWQIIISAAAISLLSYIFMPDSYIFFGILHNIALSSLIGLFFINAPVALTIIFAIGVFALPIFFQSAFFNASSLLFLGLYTVEPRSNDFVPLFPWFSAVLIGIAAGRFMKDHKYLYLFKNWSLPFSADKPLSFIGRHSLAFYLLHQPILIGCVFLISLVFPPHMPARAFLDSCQSSCSQDASIEMCQQYCGCVVQKITDLGIADNIYRGPIDERINEQLQSTANQCSMNLFTP